MTAFGMRAQTVYMLPIGLSPIFKFFLKSRKAKYDVMSPKTHCSAALSVVIEALNDCASLLNHAPWYGT